MAVLKSILSSRVSDGAYYHDNLLAMKLLREIFRISENGVLSFNRMVHWRIEHETPSLSWSERCRLHSFNTVAAEFTGSEPSRQ